MARLEAGMANMQIMTAEHMAKQPAEEEPEEDDEEEPEPEGASVPTGDASGLTPDQLEALSDPRTMQRMMQPHVMQKILTMLQDVSEEEEATTTAAPKGDAPAPKKPI